MTEKARILVAEDDMLLLGAIRDILELDGYSVCGVTNGVQSLEAFSHFRPDLIVTDVAKPERGGFELYRRLQRQSHGTAIPFVFISARDEAQAVKQVARNNSAYSFLRKPFGPEELLEAVRKLLGRREPTPRSPVDLSPAGANAAEEGDVFKGMSNRLKVLLVEDNPLDARLLRVMLAEVRDAPFDLECADWLSTGLERLAAGGIDMVLLDLMLPDSRGLDTFSRVYAQALQVPIIVLSSPDDEELAVKAIREGAQDYLVKGQMNSSLLMHAMRCAIERKRAEEGREKRILELQDALAKVKTLSGLLPICSSCKGIRDDKGCWNQLEDYIQEHSDAVFSHSLCPECAKKLYPEIFKDDE